MTILQKKYKKSMLLKEYEYDMFYSFSSKLTHVGYFCLDLGTLIFCSVIQPLTVIHIMIQVPCHHHNGGDRLP